MAPSPLSRIDPVWFRRCRCDRAPRRCSSRSIVIERAVRTDLAMGGQHHVKEPTEPGGSRRNYWSLTRLSCGKQVRALRTLLDVAFRQQER